VLLIDGLAFGVLPPDLLAALDRPLVALIHHPLDRESGLSAARRAALLASERAALAYARAVVATSPLTARLLAAEYAVPAAAITVAEPGTEPGEPAPGTGSPVQILAVGAVSARKGYDLLVAALAGLRALDWQAVIVGALDREPRAAADLRAALRETGLERRIALAGAVSDAELEVLYRRADLFVSPSRFEGYGMALAEAQARGLPLVASTGGAAAETVPDAAALKVPPGDVDALREALRRMVLDPSLRAACAREAWTAGQELPRWAGTAERVAAVLRSVRP
jgi:glycosyltransferase involved in cell wall biosynthesis